MLTSNLWPQVGLCNGAAGCIKKILYSAGQQPPSLPICILVCFDKYTGPPFSPDDPKCVPIPPIIFKWEHQAVTLSRQQFPLQLRYAITIHKSQGQTLHKAVMAIESIERTAGVTFVAVSRLTTLECGLIHKMPFERLQAISNTRNLALCRLEDLRLQHLSDQL